MRLLFVAVRSPFVGYSGNALILRNHLSVLHDRHEIDLIALGRPGDAAHPDLRRWCTRVLMVPPPSAVARRLAQATGLLSGRPLRVSTYASAALGAAATQLARERAYDAAVVQLCEAAQFRPRVAQLPCVMDFEDPPAVKLQRTLPWLDRKARIAAHVDLGLMPQYEAAVAVGFDRLVFVSASDAETFGRTHGCAGKVARIHHAVVPEAMVPGFDSREPGRVIVTGNMAHPPNVAAVNYLCRDVFPRIRQRLPGATLRLVGANPVPEVRAWGGQAGITVTGAVPDVRAELVRSRVALCGVPVVLGAQTKVLEAMATGTPVVTTTAGNHGVDGLSGRDLHVADDPDRVADRTVQLLRGEGWDAMSASALALVRTSFSPSQAAEALERVIAEAIGEHRSRI